MEQSNRTEVILKEESPCQWRRMFDSMAIRISEIVYQNAQLQARRNELVEKYESLRKRNQELEEKLKNFEKNN